MTLIRRFCLHGSSGLFYLFGSYPLINEPDRPDKPINGLLRQ